MFVHSVYFWLKNETTPQEREFFSTQLNTLKDIGSVGAIYIGAPVASDKPTVDSSFDYALTLIFDDSKAHDAYQIDPLHQAFLKNCSLFFEKVRIYDSN